MFCVHWLLKTDILQKAPSMTAADKRCIRSRRINTATVQTSPSFLDGEGWSEKWAAVTYRCILLLKGLGSKARHVVYDWSKVCWPIEANVGEAGGVGLGDTFHTYRREADKFFIVLVWNLHPAANCLSAVLWVNYSISSPTISSSPHDGGL